MTKGKAQQDIWSFLVTWDLPWILGLPQTGCRQVLRIGDQE